MSLTAPAARQPLRAVGGHGGCDHPASARHLARGQLHVADGRPRVIVVGGEATHRRTVREHVRATLGDARVCETSDLWDVLVQAPTSHLVILAGDLAEAPADELERLLGHRHPELKVLAAAGDLVPEPGAELPWPSPVAEVVPLQPRAARPCADVG